jgi:hypothetical protein
MYQDNHDVMLARLATDKSLYGEILQRAADAVGGEAELANRLHYDAKDVRVWMQGVTIAPLAVYIRALEFLATNGEAVSSQTEPR